MGNFEKSPLLTWLTGVFVRLLFSATLFTCLLLPEIGVAQITAVFKDSSHFCYKHKDVYYTKFCLLADLDQFKIISEKAASMPETMDFVFKKKKDSSFECTIQFHHPPANNYVLKILRFLEIGLISIEGTLISLDQCESPG